MTPELLTLCQSFRRGFTRHDQLMDYLRYETDATPAQLDKAAALSTPALEEWIRTHVLRVIPD